MNNGGIHLVVRRFWRAETGFYIGIWLFFTVMGRSRLFRDPGTFWHTVAGRRILDSGVFSDTDAFSFTFAGKTWIPHQWLGECLMAVLDGIGGLDMLLLATATVLAGLYTWAAHRLLKSGLHWLPAAFLTMLTVAVSANHLHVRPHISTILFLGLTFGWLCDFEAGRIGVGRLFRLIPIFWVWSNMHGGALGGLATMVLALAGWCVYRLAGLESPIERPRQAILVVLLIAACGLTFVVNPYGLHLPLVWLEIMRSPVVARLIQEHAPLDPRGLGGWLVLLFGLIYAATLASVRPWRPLVTWLIPLVWFSRPRRGCGTPRSSPSPPRWRWPRCSLIPVLQPFWRGRVATCSGSDPTMTPSRKGPDSRGRASLPASRCPARLGRSLALPERRTARERQNGGLTGGRRFSRRA